MTQTITTQPLTEAQKRAALTIINVALGEDPVIADQHSEMVSADLLDYQIMRLFRWLPDTDKHGVLTLIARKAH
jgi:hypothetical protein